MLNLTVNSHVHSTSVGQVIPILSLKSLEFLVNLLDQVLITQNFVVELRPRIRPSDDSHWGLMTHKMGRKWLPHKIASPRPQISVVEIVIRGSNYRKI